MTSTELSIKKAMFYIVIILVLGMWRIVSDFPIGIKSWSQMQSNSLRVHSGMESTNYRRIADTNSTVEKMKKADRMISLSNRYFLLADANISKDFQRENLRVIGTDNLTPMNNADNDMNNLFILENTRIMFDQKMFSVTDNKMNGHFEFSNQQRLNTTNSHLQYKADAEITDQFKESKELNNDDSNALQVISPKA